MSQRKLTFFLLPAVIMAVAAVVLLASCTKATAPPMPTATAGPAAMPTPTAAPAVAVPIGMGVGQRYHDIHITRLGLQCTVCHTSATPAYQDPLAQVFSLADRRACLACHKEGTTKPLYGEEWQKASAK